MYSFSSLCSVLISFMFISSPATASTTVEYENESSSVVLPALSLCTDLPGGFSRNQSIENFLILCSVDNNSTCMSQPNEWFESYEDLQYGLCYRFNSGRNMYGNRVDLFSQSRVGIENGIQLGLNVTTAASLDQAKVYVYIHENSLTSFNPRVYVPTSPGSIHYFKLNKTVRKIHKQCIHMDQRLNKNYTGNRTLIDYLLITLNRSGYSQQECFNLCFGLEYIGKSGCDCNTTEYDSVKTKCVASILKQEQPNEVNIDLLNCSLKFMNDYLKASNHDDLFKKYCPPECNLIVYDITPFNYIFKSNGVNHLYDANQNSKLWTTFQTYDQAKQSLFFYTIYFDKFKFMTIVAEQKDASQLNLVDLLSKLSGLISLFFAFVSFALMISFLVNSLNSQKRVVPIS